MNIHGKSSKINRTQVANKNVSYRPMMVSNIKSHFRSRYLIELLLLKTSY